MPNLDSLSLWTLISLWAPLHGSIPNLVVTQVWDLKEYQIWGYLEMSTPKRRHRFQNQKVGFTKVIEPLKGYCEGKGWLRIWTLQFYTCPLITPSTSRYMFKPLYCGRREHFGNNTSIHSGSQPLAWVSFSCGSTGYNWSNRCRRPIPNIPIYSVGAWRPFPLRDASTPASPRCLGTRPHCFCGSALHFPRWKCYRTQCLQHFQQSVWTTKTIVSFCL